MHKSDYNFPENFKTVSKTNLKRPKNEAQIAPKNNYFSPSGGFRDMSSVWRRAYPGMLSVPMKMKWFTYPVGNAAWMR